MSKIIYFFLLTCTVISLNACKEDGSSSSSDQPTQSQCNMHCAP